MGWCWLPYNTFSEILEISQVLFTTTKAFPYFLIAVVSLRLNVNVDLKKTSLVCSLLGHVIDLVLCARCL